MFMVDPNSIISTEKIYRDNEINSTEIQIFTSKHPISTNLKDILSDTKVVTDSRITDRLSTVRIINMTDKIYRKVSENYLDKLIAQKSSNETKNYYETFLKLLVQNFMIEDFRVFANHSFDKKEIIEWINVVLLIKLFSLDLILVFQISLSFERN
jgi:hypothetical protein